MAKLHGAVIGAGLEIAAACDLRVAAENTKFSMPEVRLGIPGEAIDARRALEWGLIEEIDAGENLLGRLLSNDQQALRMQKQLLQLWEEAPLATSIAASIERFAQSHAIRK